MKPYAIFLAALAFPSFASAQNGPPTWEFVIPDGATSYTYEIVDSDPFFDDTLHKGEGAIPDEAKPGGKFKFDTKDLRCKDGEVSGEAGSSGESEAEVFVRVTWKFPGGVTTTTTSDTKTVRCKDLQKDGQ